MSTPAGRLTNPLPADKDSEAPQGLPDGTVLVACGNRRASRCEPCSRLYQGDAYQLVIAGLRGGKGVPESVASHPALFVTLTAPSFGPVHTVKLGPHGELSPCRGHSAAGVCEHGVPMACWIQHIPTDPLVGQALCSECFDYEGAVLWNARCSELWRRTRIRITRELARLAGVTEKALRAQVRVEYVKVAEYQRRGLLHFHLGVRLDGADAPFAPPPEGYTAELLTAAIEAAVSYTAAPYPSGPSHFVEAGQGRDASEGGREATLDARPAADDRLEGPVRAPYPAEALRLPRLRLEEGPAIRTARWGEQLAIDPIPAEDLTAEAEGRLSRGQVAGYLAKYATKHTEALGGLDRRLKAADLPFLPVNPHVHRLVVTSMRLAWRYSSLKLDRWAHQLGYGGHWLTKSRRWSTTFTALRQVRRDWQARRNPYHAQPAEDEERLGSWQMVGVGYRLAGDALLAQTARTQAAVAREALRELRAELEELEALAA